MKLYVGNLPIGTSDAHLEELFSPFGEVTSAHVTKTKLSGRSRGFGFVEMLREYGERAVSELNGQQVDRMVLRVHEART
jgi:RNA recognition motif-containing protein